MSKNPSLADPEVAARLAALLAERQANGLILDDKSARMAEVFGPETLGNLKPEAVEALKSGLDTMDDDTRRIVGSLPTFEENGRQVFSLEGVDQSTAPLPPLYTRMSESEFWQARAWLRFLWQKADERSASPYGTLANVLARVCSEVPARYVIPPVIQSHAALNLFVLLVGDSGASKSGTRKLSGELFDWQLPNSGLTSGEGLQTTFATPVKVTDDNGMSHWEAQRLCESAYVSVDEVSTLTTQIARAGSTTGPFLRSFWSGSYEPINKSGEKLTLPDFSFRLALVVGGQPDKLDDLLVGDGTGMAERFLLLRPVGAATRAPWENSIDFADREVYKRWLRATKEEGRRVFRHRLIPGAPLEGETVPFEYEPVITKAVKWNNFIRENSLVSNNSVATQSKGRVIGHEYLLMLQLAVLFAVIEGRTKVTYEDYALANHLMGVSREDRAIVMAQVNEARDAKVKAAGRMKGVEAAELDKTKASIERRRASNNVLHALEKKGGAMTLREARMAVRGDIRKAHADGAIDGLVEAGLARIEDRDNPQGRGDAVQWLVLTKAES